MNTLRTSVRRPRLMRKAWRGCNSRLTQIDFTNGGRNLFSRVKISETVAEQYVAAMCLFFGSVRTPRPGCRCRSAGGGRRARGGRWSPSGEPAGWRPGPCRVPRPRTRRGCRRATVSHSQTVTSHAIVLGSRIDITVVATAPISTTSMTGGRRARAGRACGGRRERRGELLRSGRWSPLACGGSVDG